MRNKTMILPLAVGGWLVLAAGCGKMENPAPATPETDKTIRDAKTDPTPAAEKLADQATNAVAATPEAARPVPETVANVTSTAVTPVKEAAPAVRTAVSPAAGEMQGLASLSQNQMVQGLQDALAKGLEQAIARLGHDGGFLTNLNVKIPMPEKLQTVEKVARAMKQEKLADDFVATMNHAAEQAVPKAASVFADALKQMTIEDAKSILSGPNDAATQYFRRTTQTNLYARFYPIVQKATEQVGVTAAYKNLMAKANVTQGLGSLGSTIGGSLLGKDSMDIDAYVANKALDGLFKMVAEQEQQIRQNPVARTTETLQKVFGALKK